MEPLGSDLGGGDSKARPCNLGCSIKFESPRMYPLNMSSRRLAEVSWGFSGVRLIRLYFNKYSYYD